MNYRTTSKNCKKSLANAALIGLLSCISVVDANAFSLDDAIIFSHENNYQILAEAQNYESSKMELPKAIGGFLPTVSANGAQTKTKFTSPEAEARTDIQHRTRTKGATVTQPIFNGGDTYAQVRIAQYSKKSGLSRFNDTSNTITVQAVTSYDGVLSSREIYEINIQNEEIFRKSLEYSRIRFDAGVITKTDVLQSEVKYSDAQASKERAYANMKNSEAAFKQVVGIEVPASLDPIDVSNITLPSNVDEVIEISKENNPALKAYKYDYEAAKYGVNRAVSRVLPSVYAQAQFNRSDRPNDISNTYDSNTYTVNLSVPIFQGGGEYASIKQSRHQANKADYDYRQIDTKVVQQAIQVWNNYKTAQAVLKTRKDGIAAATEALDGVQEEVNIGTRTTIDLLNAQTDLFNARVAERQARSDLVTATYQMLQTMGALTPANADYLDEVSGS